MPFEPRHHQEAADHCRQLAEQIPWSSLILERWPAPFAFEYGRLREELRHGQLLAAMFQLKDCAEVLLKLVVCTAGRVLIEHGDPVHQREARQFLLPGRGKKLAMGDWANDGIKLIDAMRRLPEPEGWQPWDSVGRLLRDAQSRKPTSTRLAKELVEIVGWRNQELGHGALRLNFMDFIEGEDAFEDRLRQFHEGLLRHDNAWDDIALVAADGDTAIALTGHAALDENQSALAALLAQRALLPLRLERRTGGATAPTLGLGPYVCLRRRSRKEEVGCYVLNKRIGERHKAQLNLLDYGSGDTAVVGRATGEPTLLAELEHLPEEAVTAEQAAIPLGDIQDREVREFLDGISFQREYVPPEYLRQALRSFIAAPARDRGVFWLCGPADVGKTLFAYGLATIGAISTILGEDQPPPLVAELIVIVIAIRREYRGTPAALSSDVQMALDRSGDAYFMGLERFLYDAAFADDRPGAFCAWLARIRDQSVGTTGRLLLVLDGLDELPQLDPSVEGGSIAGLLPAAQGLPERVFLLLTSRGRDPAQPLDACPEAVYSAIQTAFIASAEHLRQRYDLDPRSHSDYRAVLRVFFEQRLAGLKLEPAACAALFEQTLEHSEYRFKTLSYFAALLASQAISPADVAAVSATPLREHLAALAAWEPPRKFALIRRILLELAAAEQAHEAEIRWMEPAPVIDRQWLGLDVLELAGRVGYPATQPRELDPRFLTALYSVRELLRSYRGAAAATSRFALGLKGMLEQLATLEEWDTTETLLQLSQNALDEYYAASDEEAQTAALIRLGGPLAALVDRGVRVRCWDTVEVTYWVCINQANVYQEAYRTQEALQLCVTAQSLVMLAGSPDEPEETQTTLRHRVAGASMTRGNVWQRRNQFKAAIADYDAAIAMIAALRTDLEPQGRWEIELRNGLAAAYMNRGNAKYHASEYGPSAAVADCDAAIAIRDALRADLEPQGRWEMGLRNDLANAYMNRGIAKQHASDYGPRAAVADYDTAIVIRAALRADLEPQGRWEIGLRNDLAAAYLNRGNAKQDASEYGPSAAVADYDTAIVIRAALRVDLEPQGRWEIGLRNDLAAAYLNRGNAKQGASDYGPRAAMADYDEAIAIQEVLRSDLEPQGRWEMGLRNDLAMAYMNRGNAKQGASDYGPRAAVADYDAAIAIREALRAALELQGRWEMGLRNDLANAYGNRGTAKQDASDYGPRAAVADHDAAIAIREALRADLEPQGRWEIGLRNDLANAYMNRGTAKYHASDYGPSAAVADYDEAIAMMAALRADLEPQGRWEMGLRNDLANAYINRGNAKQDASEYGPRAAMADYDEAIAMMTALRADLEPQGRWEIGLRNDLAAAYLNRGNAKQGASDYGPRAAMADYDEAIAIQEVLRSDLEPQGRWEMGLRNDLAMAYMNRGNAKQGASDYGPRAAVADYDAAIAIREALRAALELQGRWEMGLRNDLANAYGNRGTAKQDASDYGPRAAVADHDAAIAIREALRADLEPQGRWEIGLRNDLANAYMNRGTAKYHASDYGPSAAVADYDEAIAMMAALRADLEPQGHWEMGLRNDLANAYINRGNAKQDASEYGPRAAMADYDEAIAMMTALRADLEPQGRWEMGLRNDLARAYINRGNAKYHASEYGPRAAMADYDEAIAMMAALRADLEPQGRWEMGLRNDLANAYMNRGTAKQLASEYGPRAAMADYDEAIAIRAALRADLEPQGRWEMGLRNDLAMAYMNRGTAKQHASEYGPRAAMADYDEAIAIREALRADLEPQGRWEMGLRNDLANAYINRGTAKQHASEYGPRAAMADYDEAIAIREALRADLEPQGRWEMGLRNDLANAYINRGTAKQDASEYGPRAAITDYDEAIAIREALRADLEPQGRWEERLRYDLIRNYVNRSIAQYRSKHFIKSVQDRWRAFKVVWSFFKSERLVGF